MEFIYLIPIVFLSWAVCIWHARRFNVLGRLVSKLDSGRSEVAACPGVTIIIPVHNHAAYLKGVLPLFLRQRYAGEFDIIVVDEQSDDETPVILEELEFFYPHLSHTLCPASARDISKERLALTLGVRLAEKEWVMFLKAGCRPRDLDWLASYMAQLDSKVDAGLGISVLEPLEVKRVRNMMFYRAWHWAMWLPGDERVAPMSGEPVCLAYRRRNFLAQQGFASGAVLVEGAEVMLLNKNVAAERCALCIMPAAQLREDAPDRRMWKQERTFFVETRQHLIDMRNTRVRYATQVAAEACFLVSGLILAVASLPRWYFAVCVLALWCILENVFRKRFTETKRALGLPDCSFAEGLLRHRIPLWELSAWLRWRRTDKRTFRRKFV